MLIRKIMIKIIFRWFLNLVFKHKNKKIGKKIYNCNSIDNDHVCNKGSKISLEFPYIVPEWKKKKFEIPITEKIDECTKLSLSGWSITFKKINEVTINNIKNTNAGNILFSLLK